MSHPKPVSLIAERAVRYLRRTSDPVESRALARELLSTRTADVDAARRLLESAFDGDPRLVCEDGLWRVSDLASPEPIAARVELTDPDRVMVFVRGGQTDPATPYATTRPATTRPATTRPPTTRPAAARIHHERAIATSRHLLDPPRPG